jgi:AraC-like DNA-binding protein
VSAPDFTNTDTLPITVRSLRLVTAMPPRREKGLTITLVRSGSFRKVLPDRSIQLTRGQLVICDSSVLASQMPLSPTSMMRLEIGDDLLQRLGWFGASAGLAVVTEALSHGSVPLVFTLTDGQAAAIAASMTRLLNAQGLPGQHRLQRFAYFMEVVAEIDEAIGDASNPRRSSRDQWRPEIKHAVELLERSPGRQWTLDELSARVHLSRSQLVREFRREVGVTAFRFLREVRLRRMATALRSSGVSMTEAARRSGMANGHRARVLFEERWGQSPAEFRITGHPFD